MTNGFLIAIEGGDGAGKSSLCRALHQHLSAAGYEVVDTRWNSAELTKKAIKRAKKKRLFLPTTYALLHAADLADRLHRDVIPALSRGAVVISDRYVPTGLVRDGVRGCDAQWLRNLYSFAPKADAVLYLDAPVEMTLLRKHTEDNPPSFYEAGMDVFSAANANDGFRSFQARIRDAYLKLSYSPWSVIDATKSPADVQRDAIRIVDDAIKSKKEHAAKCGLSVVQLND